MKKCSYIITVLLSVACSQSYRDATEEISFYEFSEKTFHELPENVFDAISYTPVSVPFPRKGTMNANTSEEFAVDMCFANSTL